MSHMNGSSSTVPLKTIETIDQFVMRLRHLSETCEFGALQDQLIRDRIIIGITDEAGIEHLLRERPVPDLNHTIDNLRAAEMSRSHKEIMSGKASSVDHLKYSGHGHSPQPQNQGSTQRYQGQSYTQNRRNHSNPTPKKFKCNWCGKGNPPHARRDCPAKESTCTNCKKKGHWSVACKSMSAHEIQEGNEADEIQDSYDTEPQYTNNGFLEEVVEAIEDDFWSANIHVNSNETTFKLDTGSKICVVGSSTPWTKRVKLMPTDSQFKGPGGVKLDHLIISVIPQAKLTIDNRVH